MTSADYTPTEAIITTAAHLLTGVRTAFAGVGLPTLAVDLAQRTIDPEIELVYESGVSGAHPEFMAEGVADAVVASGAASVVSMQSFFGYMLQGGRIDVGILGAAQIDRYGSLNTSVIGDWRQPKVRLPGSGGAPDVMANAREVIVLMRRHDLGAMPAALDFITSPSPVAARESGVGIEPAGFGVSRVVTPLGVLTRRERFGEFELTHVHPGVSVDEVQANTGWELPVAPKLQHTAEPTADEVRILRAIDTVRLYLR